LYLRTVINAYFAYYNTTRLFFKTKKDQLYSVKRDKKGAMLPDSLIVSRPQRFIPEDKLAEVLKQPRETIKLAS